MEGVRRRRGQPDGDRPRPDAGRCESGRPPVRQSHGARLSDRAPDAVRGRFDAAAHLLTRHRDIIEARAFADDAPPPALASRGWAAFLLGLDDGALEAIEAGGHDAEWPKDTPETLRALVVESRVVCTLSSIAPRAIPPRPARKRETPRKRAQVDAFASVLLPLAQRARRVIDVGSGHGHLTREIAERIALPVIGLERSADRAARARDLSRAASPTFDVTDVLRDGLPIAAGDCAIGLHACGELGDALTVRVAEQGASLALVACCLQKRRAPSRPSLVLPGDASLDLPRALLGLSNLAAGDTGVEASRAENLAGRAKRLALHRLLERAFGPLRFGAEIEGLNRRAAQGDLASLVHRAFARRAREAPPSAQIDEAAAWAQSFHARSRRLSLPRAILARVLEVFVLCDRASYLAARGFDVTIGTLFAPEVSARNLVLLSEPARARSGTNFPAPSSPSSA